MVNLNGWKYCKKQGSSLLNIFVLKGDAYDNPSYLFYKIDTNTKNGLGTVLGLVKSKPTCEKYYEIKSDIEACYEDQLCINTVKSDKGIINIHVTLDFNIY